MAKWPVAGEHTRWCFQPFKNSSVVHQKRLTELVKGCNTVAGRESSALLGIISRQVAQFA